MRGDAHFVDDFPAQIFGINNGSRCEFEDEIYRAVIQGFQCHGCRMHVGTADYDGGREANLLRGLERFKAVHVRHFQS